VHTGEVTVKPANSGAMETAAAVKSTHSATVKSTHSAAVEAAAATMETPTATAATAMRPSVGEIWLAERGSAQQSSCDCQSPSYPGPGSRFA
jgi:hypothetical protein